MLEPNEALPSEYKDYQWLSIPQLNLGSNKIITEATIPGHKVAALWDTGSNKMLITQGFAEQLSPDVQPQQDMFIKEFYLHGVNFGPLMFTVIPGAKTNPQITIGAPFFKKHVVQFQLDKKQPKVLVGG